MISNIDALVKRHADVTNMRKHVAVLSRDRDIKMYLLTEKEGVSTNQLAHILSLRESDVKRMIANGKTKHEEFTSHGKSSN